MRKIAPRLFISSLLTLSVLVLPAPAIFAQDSLFPEEICTPDTPSEDSAVCSEAQEQENSGTDPVSGPGGIISDAVNILATVAGVAAVIIIVYSGFVFATSGGSLSGQRSGDNPSRAKKARATLLGAVIGLVMIALSWAFIRFIIDRVL